MKKEIKTSDLYLTADQADALIEEGKEVYIVFENQDYISGPHKGKCKNYDLTKGIFKDFEAAKDFAQYAHSHGDYSEPVHVASYADYSEGCYEYLFTAEDTEETN